MKRVLVACECSGRVRDAFIARGFDAWSCDIQDTRAPGPHLKCDVREVLSRQWDLMVAHPPCTHLAVSGADHFWYKEGLQERALKFVELLMNAPIPSIAIENPVGIISTRIRKPTQYIQPYHYGHPETKKTGLWLKNLPCLVPTKPILPKKDAQGFNPFHNPKNINHPDIKYLRSVTYQGIADAMAEQWGDFLIRPEV